MGQVEVNASGQGDGRENRSRPLGKKRIALSSCPPLGFVHALIEMAMIAPDGKPLSVMVFQ
jgi:hypothetical protein